MKKLILFLSILFISQHVLAQDVCCILGKKSSDSAETVGMGRSATECKPGGTWEGYTVCSAKDDPNNDCPNFGEKERCGACGYFWAGKTCLAEDPTKKAKKELEEEAKKKEAAKKKSGAPDGPPSSSPNK